MVVAEEINVRDFIQHNYTPYTGDESFLAQATPATTALWEKGIDIYLHEK
jgi:formate C-acetyltransferase